MPRIHWSFIMTFFPPDSKITGQMEEVGLWLLTLILPSLDTPCGYIVILQNCSLTFFPPETRLFFLLN